MPSPSRSQAFVINTIDQASEKSKKQLFHVSGDLVTRSRHKLFYKVGWVLICFELCCEMLESHWSVSGN